MRRDGTQGNSLHWRTAVLRKTDNRRSALESAVANRGRSRSADQFPYRLGRHGRRYGEGEDQELRENGDVCRTRGGYFPAQRRPVERLADVRSAGAVSADQVCLSRKRYRLDS